VRDRLCEPIVPGLCRIIRVDESDLDSGWSMFRALLQFWKAREHGIAPIPAKFVKSESL
jgi:hypothetical protein